MKTKRLFTKMVRILPWLLFCGSVLLAVPRAIRLEAAPYTFTTLAGSAGSAGTSDGIGTTAQFSYPSAIAVDTSGNLFVADYGNNAIRKITAAGLVTTLAGLAGSLHGGVNGVGTEVRFYYPDGISVDSVGNVFVADTENEAIRKIDINGVVTTYIGNIATRQFGNMDGPREIALVHSPRQLAIGSADTLYIADAGNSSIRKVTSAGVVSTLATSVGLLPQGVAISGAGNGYVYVADAVGNTIQRITPTGEVTLFAGSSGVQGSTDGQGVVARFKVPFCVAADSVGNVFVTDRLNHTIRRITVDGTVTTIAGLVENPGSADGTGTGSRFRFPNGIAVDAAGKLYVVDGDNHTIRVGTEASPYQITLDVLPADGGTVSGGGTVYDGTSVTVTATPANGYAFLNWTEGTIVASTSANFVFTADANRTLVANFIPVYAIEVSPTSIDFGNQIPTTTSAAKTVSITNTGIVDLTGLAITKDGVHLGDFAVDTTGMLTTLTHGSGTTFTVRFSPQAIGARSAALHVANNENSGNPFGLTLTGIGTPVPTAVGLAYFRATTGGQDQVSLSWGTVVEVQTIAFRVEREAAGGRWESIDPQFIPALGWDLLPHAYRFTDDSPTSASGAKYRLIEVNQRGQETVMAEAAVSPAITAAISRTGTGLNLEVRGAPNDAVVVESAAAVTGPWSDVERAQLDKTGKATLEAKAAEAVRFYRVFAE